MRKEYTSIYVDKALQNEIAKIAEQENRSIIDLQRRMLSCYKKHGQRRPILCQRCLGSGIQSYAKEKKVCEKCGGEGWISYDPEFD